MPAGWGVVQLGWGGATCAEQGLAGGVGEALVLRAGRQGTCGMAREQLLQVYSMTAYSWPSSSISFCKGTQGQSRQGRCLSAHV